MSKFGWSYPPGVSSLPWDEEYECEMCWRGEDDCACPECGVCGEIGNPACYDDEGHGLRETQAQIESRGIAERKAQKDSEFELAFLAELEKERQYPHLY